MDKARQRFFLDNKQSSCFMAYFGVVILLTIILGFSMLSMGTQYDKEASKIVEQGNILRTLLKNELIEKQTIQKQFEDASITISLLDREIAANTLLLSDSQAAMNNVRSQLDFSKIVPQSQAPVQAPAPVQVPVQVPVLSQGPVQDPSKSSSSSSSNTSVVEKREAVKRGFLHAWNGYKDYAWGTDELNPARKTSKNWLDLGVTIVDSLDTLWIMGLQEEFQLARDWVAESLSFDKSRSVSFFETTIRELGGLLSAYEFSKDKVFLDKAEDIGRRLLAAFREGSPIPMASVNLGSGTASSSWGGSSSILSEMGTIQLEFLYLAYHTNNPFYAEQPMKVFSHLDSLDKQREGLYPLYVDQKSGKFKGNDYSIGALGDSFYEYMVKLWLFTDKQGTGYKRMYEESARGMDSYLLQTSDSGYRYMAQTSGGRIQQKMEHLTCFSGGMFALGAAEGVTPEVEKHFKIAEDLTTTCHGAYDSTKTKLGAETFEFRNGKDFVIASRGSGYYILRPEVVESYFVLWRTTHDQKYRDWAWEAFTAIETHCRMEAGYSGLRYVDEIPVQHDDTMQSFFLAETLKYLYLIFSDDDVVPLGDYVFNTEAHPLGKIREPLSEWNPQIASLIMTQ